MSALCDDAVPRRLAGARGRSPLLGRRQRRLVAAALVLRQGADPAVRLRLAAGHPAPAALRPVHAASAGRCCSRSTWSGSWSWPGMQVHRRTRTAAATGWLVIGGVGRGVLLLATLLWPSREAGAGSRRSQEQVDDRPHGQLPGAAAGPAGTAEPAGQARRRRAASRPTSAAGSRLDEGGVTWARSPDSVKGFGVTFSHMFRRSSPTEVPVRARRSRRRATTAGTSSTGTRTGWRSASAASCAPGPARRTRSTSRAATTPRTQRFSPG